MRIIIIARHAMFVSGLFKIPEAKIVYTELNSVDDQFTFLIPMMCRLLHMLNIVGSCVLVQCV